MNILRLLFVVEIDVDCEKEKVREFEDAFQVERPVWRKSWRLAVFFQQKRHDHISITRLALCSRIETDRQLYLIIQGYGSHTHGIIAHSKSFSYFGAAFNPFLPINDQPTLVLPRPGLHLPQ
jgi:hypothetical protein